ncbi:MAG: hypothetical protein LBK46_09580 [Oscillospiraceae bacterium]|jgi:hypothetical protein|nr:hypothetical protein [Oscillospiraceae bacterium]
MKERQAAGGVVALAALFLMLMRFLSPGFRAGFDWIALGLTALAAAGVMMPVLLTGSGRRAEDRLAAPSEGEAAGGGSSYSAALTLRDRAARLGWITPEGGVYDALIKLSHRNAHAALSGAYATLTLLLNPGGSDGLDGGEFSAAIQSLVQRKRMREPEAELLISLLDALDERCTIGAARIDEQSQNALLDTTLSAIAFLERVA